MEGAKVSVICDPSPGYNPTAGHNPSPGHCPHLVTAGHTRSCLVISDHPMLVGPMSLPGHDWSQVVTAGHTWSQTH